MHIDKDSAAGVQEPGCHPFFHRDPIKVRASVDDSLKVFVSPLCLTR